MLSCPTGRTHGDNDAKGIILNFVNTGSHLDHPNSEPYRDFPPQQIRVNPYSPPLQSNPGYPLEHDLLITPITRNHLTSLMHPSARLTTYPPPASR